jgi:hypothetical protein
MTSGGTGYRRLLRVHPPGPDRDDLSATLLELAREPGAPLSRREMLGVLLLGLRRRLGLRALLTATAGLAILMVATAAAFTLSAGSRQVAGPWCDAQPTSVWGVQNVAAKTVFGGAVDVYGVPADCSEGNHLELDLYLERGWDRPRAETALRAGGWQLIHADAGSSLWWAPEGGMHIRVEQPVPGSFDTATIVTVTKSVR